MTSKGAGSKDSVPFSFIRNKYAVGPEEMLTKEK